MAVMVPRENLTEHRFDALEKKVDEGSHRLDALEKKVDEGFSRMDARFEHLEGRFDALNRTLIGGFFVVVAALIGLVATQI